MIRSVSLASFRLVYFCESQLSTEKFLQQDYSPANRAIS